MINDGLLEAPPSQDDAFVSRVNGDIAGALASVATGSGRESFYRAHPVEALCNSLLVWAIEAKAAEIRFLPQSSRLFVQLHSAGLPEQTLSLPKPLQEPLAFKLKVSAEMDIDRRDVPQEGMFPIRYREADYEAIVAARPTEYAESLTVRLVTK